MRRALTFIVLAQVAFGALAVSPASAADTNGDGLEVILLPIAFTTAIAKAGAHGSIWSGQVWVHNGGPDVAGLVNGITSCGVTCNAAAPGGYTGPVGPIPNPEPDRGLILDPHVAYAPKLQFMNRIFETTRYGQPKGVDIPVVREGSFFSTPRMFLDIPVGSDVRTSVRVYDPRVWQPSSVGYVEALDVEFLDLQGNVLVQTVLRPAMPSGAVGNTLHPGFDAIFDVAQAFPELRGRDRINIRISPTRVGPEFWAMIAVTHNDTQTVSIITSQ